MQITTIGLDIAKNVFQVHGIDAAEKVVVRKQLRRGQVLKFFAPLPPCLVGLEACATAHYWSRELTKLGHEVRLMPAKDVKAYVKRNKNDAADAEADLLGALLTYPEKLEPVRKLGVIVLSNQSNIGMPDAVGLWAVDRLLGNRVHRGLSILVCNVCSHTNLCTRETPAFERAVVRDLQVARHRGPLLARFQRADVR